MRCKEKTPNRFKRIKSLYVTRCNNKALRCIVTMYPNPGGFQQQDSNNAFSGQQPHGGYPTQNMAGYPPQGATGYPAQGTAGYPPQAGTGYPSQGITGYPPHEAPGYPSQGSPNIPQQPGYPPQHTPYPFQGGSYPNQPMGYPPQQMQNMPQGGGIQPNVTNLPLPYGMSPSFQPAQPSRYPDASAAYPPQQSTIGGNVHSAQQQYGYPAPQQQASPYNVNSNQFGSGSTNPQGLGTTHQNKHVELSVSCTNLKDQDMMSKSDPVCVLFEKRSGTWAETGRTEMISNNHHPTWQKKFVFNYNPQTTQELKFEIYDWDSKSQKLKKHDILGQIEVSLGTIVSSAGKQYTSSLKNGGGGRITILAEETNPRALGKIKLQLMGHKLDSKDTFGKSDPYYNLSKKMGNGQWSLVYRSEVIKNNSNPKWVSMEKPITELCNGDYDREMKIEVLDYDSSGENDLIGEFTTNIRSLSTGVRNQTKYEVINPKKQRNKRSYKNSGTISVVDFRSFDNLTNNPISI